MRKSYGMLLAGVGLTFLLSWQPASAGLFGDSGGGIGGMLGGGGSNTESYGQLSDELGGLSRSFSVSFGSLATAEALTAEALGLKDQAAALRGIAAYYGSGTIDDYDQVPRDVTVASDAQTAIDAKMASSQTVSAEAKIKLAQAAPYYATGTLAAAQLPGEYAAWTQRAQAAVSAAGSNPMAMASGAHLVHQVPKVARLTSQLPSLVQKWITVTHNFIAFTQAHKVDTGDLSSKIGTL